LLISSASVSAQVVDHQHDAQGRHIYEGPTLSGDAAVEEALANNPALVVARLQFVPLRQQRTQQGYLAPPTLEAEIWQWPLTTANPLDTNMYMFTIRQELPGKGKRALRAAVIDKDIARADNDVVEQTRAIVTDVRQTYAELFVARQAVAVHEESVDLLRRTADLVTARYGAGHGGQSDVLKSVTEIASIHSDLVMLEERVQLATARLNTLMNRPPGAPIGEISVATDEAPLPAVDDLQRLAVDTHPDLRAARLDIERAEAQVALAQSDRKTDFMVQGGYQLMPRSAGAWTAMAGMTWPNAPWSRGRIDAAVAQANGEVSLAKAKQQVLANQIAGAVQQAFIRATAARSRATLLRTGVIPQSQQLLAAAQVAYQSDRGDASALIDNQRMVLDLQLQYFQALADLQLARVDLERAVGADLPAVNAAVTGENR